MMGSPRRRARAARVQCKCPANREERLYRERLGSYGTLMEPVSSNLEVVTPSWCVVRSCLLTEG